VIGAALTGVGDAPVSLNAAGSFGGKRANLERGTNDSDFRAKILILGRQFRPPIA
jgi:hypothetical protein